MKSAIPGFLKRADRYLLLHHPELWYMRVHYVLFAGLAGAALALLTAAVFPMSTSSVPEADPYFVGLLILTGIVTVYWAYLQCRASRLLPCGTANQGWYRAPLYLAAVAVLAAPAFLFPVLFDHRLKKLVKPEEVVADLVRFEILQRARNDRPSGLTHAKLSRMAAIRPSGVDGIPLPEIEGDSMYRAVAAVRTNDASDDMRALLDRYSRPSRTMSPSSDADRRVSQTGANLEELARAHGIVDPDDDERSTFRRMYAATALWTILAAYLVVFVHTYNAFGGKILVTGMVGLAGLALGVFLLSLIVSDEDAQPEWYVVVANVAFVGSLVALWRSTKYDAASLWLRVADSVSYLLTPLLPATIVFGSSTLMRWGKHFEHGRPDETFVHSVIIGFCLAGLLAACLYCLATHPLLNRLRSLTR